MTFSIQAIIWGLAAPECRLSCSIKLWQAGLTELARRGNGHHESGAFLLGHIHGERRSVERFVYYDDLDPGCLQTDAVVFDGAYFSALWAICRHTGFRVVADVHTHGSSYARQSALDRDNPMIAQAGHIALIVPYFAQRMVGAAELGIYEYRGDHCWYDYSGQQATQFFAIG